MDVFICWSGDRSLKVAEALSEWLPSVIQAVRPYFSPEMEKGVRWSPELAAALEQCKLGIICLTPENLNAPWILFEAGALSKTLDQSRVCPFLFDLSPSDLTSPLADFMATSFSYADVGKLVSTINKALGNIGLSEHQVRTAFEKWWPDFERRLNEIPPSEAEQKPRPDRELLEEILMRTREISTASTANLGPDSLTKTKTYRDLIIAITSGNEEVADAALDAVRQAWLNAIHTHIKIWPPPPNEGDLPF